MGDFSTDWLALREPADSRSRSAALVEGLRERLRGGPQRILDLGCGTGANLRYLAPRLSQGSVAGHGDHQEWLCLDKDPHLLTDLSRRTTSWARGQGWRVRTLPGGGELVIMAQAVATNVTDATNQPVTWLEPWHRGASSAVAPQPGSPVGGASQPPAWSPESFQPAYPWVWRVQQRACDLALGAEWLPVAPGTLVTASALLDLVSADWLAGLLRVCARAGAPLLLALSYDGRVELSPPHPLDETLIALVNTHQCGDKGLGPALGPSAPARLRELASPLRLELDLVPSDWELGPEETELQSALVAGWVIAAGEQVARIEPASSARLEEIRRWHKERQGQMAAGRLRVRVGHQDALLWPGAGGRRHDLSPFDTAPRGASHRPGRHSGTQSR